MYSSKVSNFFNKDLILSNDWCNDPIKGVIIDINSTLKDPFNKPIPDSITAFRLLQKSGIPYKLITNESARTKQYTAKCLRCMGFKVEEKDIISPIPVLVKMLIENHLRPHLLVSDYVSREFSDVKKDRQNCVVIGDAEQNFTYNNLNTAFQILKDMPQPLLFSLGNRKYCKGEYGFKLDVGSYTKTLEHATGVNAKVIGKPSPEFFHLAAKDMGLEPKDVIMIGDDYECDINGAQICGMRGILIWPLKYRHGVFIERGPRLANGVVRNFYEAVMIIRHSKGIEIGLELQELDKKKKAESEEAERENAKNEKIESMYKGAWNF